MVFGMLNFSAIRYENKLLEMWCIFVVLDVLLLYCCPGAPLCVWQLGLDKWETGQWVMIYSAEHTVPILANGTYCVSVFTREIAATESMGKCIVTFILLITHNIDWGSINFQTK